MTKEQFKYLIPRLRILSVFSGGLILMIWMGWILNGGDASVKPFLYTYIWIIFLPLVVFLPDNEYKAEAVYNSFFNKDEKNDNSICN